MTDVAGTIIDRLRRWAWARLQEQRTWRGLGLVLLAVILLVAAFNVEGPRFGQVKEAVAWIGGALGMLGAGEVIRMER